MPDGGGDVFIELQKRYTLIEKIRLTPYDKYTKRVGSLAGEVIDNEETRVRGADQVTPLTSPVKSRALFHTPTQVTDSPAGPFSSLNMGIIVVGDSATASPAASAATSTPSVGLNLGVIFIGDSGTTSAATSPVFTPSTTPLKVLHSSNAVELAAAAPKKLQPLTPGFFNTPPAAAGSGGRVIAVEDSPQPQTTVFTGHNLYHRWFSPNKKANAGAATSAAKPLR